MALVVYGLCMVVVQYPVVRVAGRRDLMLALALSCLAQGLGIGIAPFVPWPATLACIAAIAFGVVLLIPIASAVVSRLAPVELRGRYMGVWTLVYMGGYAIGPLLGGWALDRLGGRVSFALTAGVCLLGVVCFPLLRRAVRERGRVPEPLETDDAFGGELVGERPEQAV
jgi:MFS family permease